MMVTIGELLDDGLVEAVTGFPSGQHNQEGNGIPHLRPFNVTVLGTSTLEQIKYVSHDMVRPQHRVLPGDVLFNNTNSKELVGKTALWTAEGRFTLSNHMTRVRVLRDADLSPAFLALALHHHWRSGRSRQLCRRHVAQASIIGERFREITIPLPPRAEQEAVAGSLGTIQRAVTLHDTLIATTDKLKQGAMRQVFARGLYGRPRKDTDIGPIPDNWEIARLGTLGRIGNGSTPKRTNPAYWAHGTLPWLTSGKIHERIISAADEFVTPVAARECHLPKVPSGSLLIAITGQGKTLGNVAITKIDTFVSQHLAYITIYRRDVDAAFMRHYLSSRYEYLRGLGQAGGSTKGAITCAGLKMVPVPVPPLEEQQEIARMLDLIERKTETHKRKHALLKELFDTLLHDLMTGRLRVPESALAAAV